MASLGGTAPGDTLQGDNIRLKLYFVSEFRKNTVDKRREKMGVVRRRQLKRSSLITFRGDD